jgi:hypothetical protein
MFWYQKIYWTVYTLEHEAKQKWELRWQKGYKRCGYDNPLYAVHAGMQVSCVVQELVMRILG